MFWGQFLSHDQHFNLLCLLMDDLASRILNNKHTTSGLEKSLKKLCSSHYLHSKHYFQPFKRFHSISSTLKQHLLQTCSAIKSGTFWECQYHTHVLNKMALNNHSAIANTASTIWFSKLHSMNAKWQKSVLVVVVPPHGQSRNYLIIPSILHQSFYKYRMM